MPRPVTLFTGQWADLPLEELAQKASEWGYQGLELCCWGDHFEVQRAAQRGRLLPAQARPAGPPRPAACSVISNHRVGQAVCDRIDARHQALLPDYVWGDGEPGGRAAAGRRGDDGHRPGRPEARRRRRQRLHRLADLALRRRLSRPTPREMIADGFKRLRPHAGTRSSTSAASAASASPCEVHPGADRLRPLHAPSWPSTPLGGREEFGFTFDPSHLHWQGVDPVEFLRRFPDRIYHVHVKDAAVTLNGRTGILGSLPAVRRPAPRLGLPLAGPRRHRLGGGHPRPERDRLRRPAVGGVGGRRHGPRVRRRGRLPVRQAARLRALPPGVRRGFWRSVGHRRVRRGGRGEQGQEEKLMDTALNEKLKQEWTDGWSRWMIRGRSYGGSRA